MEGTRRSEPPIPRGSVETVQGMLLQEADQTASERPDYATGLKRAVEKITFELGTSPDSNPYQEGTQNQ